MALYLVQHGLAQAKSEDPCQPLSSKGEEQVKLIASVAHGYQVVVEKIVHSPKPRARQTAKLMAETLSPKLQCQELKGLSPLDDPVAFSKDLRANDNMMVVSHLPFLNRLTSLLVCGQENTTVFRFQNGGIVCLDQDADHDWYIKWALMPQIS